MRKPLISGAAALALATLTALTLPAASAQDNDEVAREIARSSGLWKLDFKHDTPRWISMNRDVGDHETITLPNGKTIDLSGMDPETLPGEFSGTARQLRTENWWYLYYEVTNSGQEDRRFFLNFTGRSDRGATYHDVKDVAVFKKVEEILRSRGKLKKDETLHSSFDMSIPEKPGDLEAAFPRKLSMPVIRAGETKKGVAIFRRFDLNMDKLVISVEGLQNDQLVISPSDTKTPDGKDIPNPPAPHRRRVTTRVLELTFSRPGNEQFTANKTPKFVSRKWVSRTREIKTDLGSPGDN